MFKLIGLNSECNGGNFFAIFEKLMVDFEVYQIRGCFEMYLSILYNHSFLIFIILTLLYMPVSSKCPNVVRKLGAS